MTNRLANATSPYLLQHQHNPVDWWEWQAEAFRGSRRSRPADTALGRLRGLPLVPRHGARVVRGRGRGRGPQRATSSRSRSTARSGPTSTRSTWTATTAMTGQGGWPMTCILTPGAEPFFAGTYLPEDAAPGAAGRRDRRLDEPPRGRPRQRCQRGGTAARRRPEGGARRHRRRRARPGGRPRWRAGSTRATADSAARRSSRRRWCWSSCCATTPGPATARCAADGRRHLRGDGPRRHVRPARRRLRALLRRRRPGSCRTSRRCSTTTPSCCASTSTCGAPPASPLAERVARETADFLLSRPAHRPRAGSPRPWTPTPTASRASTYAWTPRPAGRGARRGGRRARRATLLVGDRRRDLRARHVDPAAADRPRRRRPGGRTAAGAAAGRPARPAAAGPRRQGRHVLERPGDRRPRRGRRPAGASRATSTPPRRCAGFLLDRALVDGRLRRSSRGGVVGAAAGVLDDHGNLAEGLLALHQATGEHPLAG